MNTDNKIVLIDGHSIINRAFYGMPPLTNSEGIHTNAVYGFLNILFKLLDEEKPQYLLIAFDLPKPTFRHLKFAEYKGTRKKMPDELVEQVPLLKNVLKAMGIKTYSLEGYEADDVLGTISKTAEEQGMKAVIVSGDKDLLQIASESIKIRIPKTKGGKTEIEDYFEKDVIKKYEVTPTQYIDVKALMGDTSDNIPGVPGIGEITAFKIIKEYKSIESAIENAENIKPKKASENLIAFKEQAVFSKELATIDTHAPVCMSFDECHMPTEYTEEAVDLFKRLEFRNLLNRVSVTKQMQNDKTKKYVRISNKKQLDELMLSLNNKTAINDETTAYYFHIDNGLLVGVSLCFHKDECNFIPVGIEMSELTLLECIKPFLENESIQKTTHDIKKDIVYLKDAISISNVKIDVMLAAYLLNSLKNHYDIEDLANFTDITIPVLDETKGRGKKKWYELSDATATNYACSYVDVIYSIYANLKEELTSRNMKELYFNMERPLIDVLADMEKKGILVDENVLTEYGGKLEIQIKALEKEIFSLSGEEFNIHSPKQLGVILFEKLALKSAKKTKTGYSTSAEVLEKLIPEHAIISKILDYRTYTKIKSTYVDGLLSVRNEKTGRIYTTFNQTITATGRLSSTEPNLQNIPVRLPLGRELRKVFIPESGYVFVDADYSQIELRILAHMSEDENLINAFNTGLDIHRLTASQVNNVPYEEVTPRQRFEAKAVNFGIIYGIGAFSLSQDLGIMVKEANKYINSYFEMYPKIKAFLDKMVSDAQESGYARTIFGRVRPMPELTSNNFVQHSFGSRVAMNMPIQGTAADIIKIAMLNVYNKFKNEGLNSRIILQVHDELLIEAELSELAKVTEIVKMEMENAVSLSVKMVADVHTGHTWFDAK